MYHSYTDDTKKFIDQSIPFTKNFAIEYTPDLFSDIPHDYQPIFHIKLLSVYDYQLLIRSQNLIYENQLRYKNLVVSILNRVIVDWNQLYDAGTGKKILFDINEINNFPNVLTDALLKRIIEISKLNDYERAGIIALAGLRAGLLEKKCDSCNNPELFGCEKPKDGHVWGSGLGDDYHSCPLKFITNEIVNWLDQYIYDQKFHTAVSYKEQTPKYIDACYLYDNHYNHFISHNDRDGRSRSDNNLKAINKKFRLNKMSKQQ